MVSALVQNAFLVQSRNDLKGLGCDLCYARGIITGKYYISKSSFAPNSAPA